MVLPLGPILAQVLSASVGDGVEGRYVNEASERHLEAENQAFATVGARYPWLDLRLTYAPSFLLTPLESSPRELEITHNVVGTVYAGGSIYETRRLIVALNLNGTFTQENSQRDLFGTPLPTAEASDPSTGPGPPPPDSSSADQARAENATTRRAGGGGDVSVTERLARTSLLTESAGYRVDSGLDRDSRVIYPLFHGPNGDVKFVHVPSRRDTLTTTVEGELSFVPSTDGRAWFVQAEQAIAHAFSRQVMGDAALGVVYTHSETPGQPTVSGVGPTGLLGLSYKERVAGGELDARMEISYAPTLDRETLVFDARAGLYETVEWTRDELRLFVTSFGTISAEPGEVGSLSGVSGNAGAAYDLGAGFSATTGVRAAWQTFGGVEIVQPTWVYYLGIFWAADLL